MTPSDQLIEEVAQAMWAIWTPSLPWENTTEDGKRIYRSKASAALSSRSIQALVEAARRARPFVEDEGLWAVCGHPNASVAHSDRTDDCDQLFNREEAAADLAVALEPFEAVPEEARNA